MALLSKAIAMNKKNQLVVKHNKLVEASYRLTLVEQRIILFAITEARRTGKGLSDQDFVTIRATDYAELFGADAKNAYEQIREAARTLFKRYLVIHDIHPESGKERMTELRWLSSASYIDGEGTIQIRFATDIVPYITRLEKEFTKYRIEQIAKMSSPYAIRLYELLMQWGGIGQREIELDWLKQALKVEDEYAAIKDFKKRVIDIAVTQINTHTDLTVSYSQRKTGRRVTHFTFAFEEKPKATPPKPKKKAKAEPKNGTRAYVEKHALPGETWEQAAQRLGTH